MSNPLNALQDSNSLIIGGAGFVGSNLVRALLDYAGATVTVIDNLLSAEQTNLPENKRLTFIEGSITDDDILRQLADEFDYIFHLATYHGNQSSMHDPLADHENNTFTTLKLCEHIKEFKKLKMVVYSSAGCTVAEKTFEDAAATQEDAPVSLYLDSPYQISKVIGELYFNYYDHQFDLPVVKARFQNVYGPGEVLGAGQWRGTPATVWRNVTPTFIYKSLNGEELPLEGGGIATRDFIYVEDIVEGLLLCAVKGEAGEVYNLASGQEISIRELAETINKVACNSTPVAVLPLRPWDRSGKRHGSTTKAQEKLGFTAKTSLEEGLRKTVEWTTANRNRIEECMRKHASKIDLYNS